MIRIEKIIKTFSVNGRKCLTKENILFQCVLYKEYVKQIWYYFCSVTDIRATGPGSKSDTKATISFKISNHSITWLIHETRLFKNIVKFVHSGTYVG